MSSLKVRVVRVIDGDSLVVEVWSNGVLTGELFEVRLSGIDAPERGQRGWRDAKARLADLVGGMSPSLISSSLTAIVPGGLACSTRRENIRGIPMSNLSIF